MAHIVRAPGQAKWFLVWDDRKGNYVRSGDGLLRLPESEAVAFVESLNRRNVGGDKPRPYGIDDEVKEAKADG